MVAQKGPATPGQHAARKRSGAKLQDKARAHSRRSQGQLKSFHEQGLEGPVPFLCCSPLLRRGNRQTSGDISQDLTPANGMVIMGDKAIMKFGCGCQEEVQLNNRHIHSATQGTEL